MGRYAILIVFGVTFSMLMYSSALRNTIFQSNIRTVESHGVNQAKNIAQSAAMAAIMDVREDINSIFNPGTDSSYSYPSSNSLHYWDDVLGDYNIEATNQGDSILTLKSLGKYGDSYYQVEVGLIYSDGEWDPIIDQAVHAEDIIKLSGGATISGHATINSTISNAVYLGSSTSIDSTLFIGPGGDPDVVVNNKHRVGEGVYNLTKELKYPMPIFPSFPSYLSSVSSIYSSQTIAPGDYENYYIPEIYLTGGAVLNIDTAGANRKMRTGRFDIQSGTVNVTGGGSLTLYVEDKIDLDGNSTVNKDGNINDLDVYYRGDETVDLGDDDVSLGGNTIMNGNFYSKEANIILNGTSGIQGNVITGGLNVSIKGNAEAISRVIYAPSATVTMAGTARIKGSVISDEFHADGNALLVYENEFDAELPDLEQEGADFEIVYWK